MNKYNVIVVGGGASGLMAAGTAAESGAKVLLLEKMKLPARKLRITGKGRCNITNIAPLPEFIKHFGDNARFLRPAFSRFFSPELINFFKTIGIKTVTERGGRVFPTSNKADDVVNALTAWVKKRGVTIQTNVSVKKLLIENGKITGVKAEQTYYADRVIIATGGASYPATGSTGDGYTLAKSAGHTIMPIRPALVPLVTTGDTAKKLQGLSLRNVSASIFINGKKAASLSGEMLFTHFGISGPIILSLSKIAGDVIKEKKETSVSIDLKPALDEKTLDARLLRDLTTHGKQQFKTFLKELLPKKLILVCADLLDIPPDKLCNQINASERKKLRIWLKDFRLKIIKHRPLNEAIITAGGISTKEINPQTMESKLVKGLYFAGEVIDLDADTGGYNLQAAFSTGWLAGRG